MLLFFSKQFAKVFNFTNKILMASVGIIEVPERAFMEFHQLFTPKSCSIFRDGKLCIKRK